MAHDPRSEAEKARAALMRNDAMGMAVPESPLERQPSVTPKTFGDDSQAAQVRSGIDQGVEAGGVRPKGGAGGGSQSLAESEQVSAGRDTTAPVRQSRHRRSGDVMDTTTPARPPLPRGSANPADGTPPARRAPRSGDEDVLSRGKE